MHYCKTPMVAMLMVARRRSSPCPVFWPLVFLLGLAPAEFQDWT